MEHDQLKQIQLFTSYKNMFKKVRSINLSNYEIEEEKLTEKDIKQVISWILINADKPSLYMRKCTYQGDKYYMIKLPTVLLGIKRQNIPLLSKNYSAIIAKRSRQ